MSQRLAVISEVQHRQYVNGAREGATGVQAGAGITIPVGYTSSIFADVNADFRSRATSFNGSIGYRLTF